MLSKIDLCSLALLKLGEEPVQSLDDNIAASQLARTLFNPIVDALLASHPWRFAKRKITLSKTTDGGFLIPGDVLRVLKCDGEIVGNKILSPSESICIDAIVRTPVDVFPGHFSSLAATKLAMEFCIPLTGDQNVFRMLVALYESELRAAKFIDGTMDNGASIKNFSLVSARY
jgi:hypothetical protein